MTPSSRLSILCPISSNTILVGVCITGCRGVVVDVLPLRMVSSDGDDPVEREDGQSCSCDTSRSSSIACFGLLRTWAIHSPRSRYRRLTCLSPLDSPPRWPLHGITSRGPHRETDNSVAQSQYLSSLRFVDLGLGPHQEHEYRHEHPHEDAESQISSRTPGMEPTDTAWPVVGVGGRNRTIRLPGSFFEMENEILRRAAACSAELASSPEMTYTFIAQRCWTCRWQRVVGPWGCTT